ncbi:MAG: carbohydrate-binding protein, partial [Terriglobales bacterium]
MAISLRVLYQFCTFTLALIATGCGGGGASSPPPPPPPAAATPVFWPVPGSYSQTQAGQTVALSDITPGATMYYTTDGTTPTTSSTKYSSGIGISSTTTVEAIAVAPGYSQSGVANGTYTLTPPGNGPTVSVVVTTDDHAMQMAPQPAVSFSTANGGSNLVYMDETEAYQQIEGFGAASTDSAMYLLNEVAKVKQKSQFTQAMSDLFSYQGSLGIGLSFIRNPMGASDIARSVYSFDDNGGVADPTLANFSIAHDQVDIIPLILQAKQLNPQLKIMANPWSPPGWMKDSGSMIGGSLLSSMYTPFANYFVKYIQAYAQAGININYISLQNEPLYVPTNYPGMCMPAVPNSSDCPTSQTDQTTALFSYMAPALSAAGIATKVLVYDHNWDRPDYPQEVLTNQNLSQIAGVAWHGYGGVPGAMTPIQNMFPGVGTYETEHSGLTTNSDQTRLDFEEITQCMRNWARAYVKWSLALDENQGPHTGGCGTCTPIVTVNSTSGNITYGPEFYTMGQFSKYVLPGATRVYSSNAMGMVTVAFVNPAPDNSRVLVAFNDSGQSQTFEVQWGTQSFTYALPALGAATFYWSGTQSGGPPAYTVSATSQIFASSFNSTAGDNTPGNYLTWGLATEHTSDTGGGYDVGYADDGDYAVYKNVDFGTGVSTVSARLACLQDNGQGNGGGNCGGTLNFRLDSSSGTLVASVTIPSTGGWESWQTSTPVSASGASGVHDLYV